jgi:hypothetical protein
MAGKLQQKSTKILFNVFYTTGAASRAVAPVFLAYDADRSMA